MDADRVFDEEYAEDLRRIVRKWTLSHYRKMSVAERAGAAEPTMADPIGDGMVRCAWVLVHAYSGAHHVGTVKIGTGSLWMEAVHQGEMATCDANLMTRLVLLGHDASVRVSVQPCNQHYLRILLHPRIRSARTITNHSTLEVAVAAMRDKWAPLPVIVPEASPETSDR